MKAAIFNGKNPIHIGQRPDPQIQDPTDAIVRVVRGCVCGSDLWCYRGINPHQVGSIGHEYIGVIEAVGPDVRDLAVGAGVKPGDAVGVVGDGAMGLSAVMGAKKLGATRIVLRLTDGAASTQRSSASAPTSPSTPAPASPAPAE